MNTALAQAEAATRALVRQITRRRPELGEELMMATGMKPVGSTTPEWLIKTIRVLVTGGADKPVVKANAPAEAVAAFGTLVGVAETFEGALTHPEGTASELAARLPQFQGFLSELHRLLQPDAAMLAKVGESIRSNLKKASDRRSYRVGQGIGASIVDEHGELVDDSSSRQDICFLLWLYAPDLGALASIRELHQFISTVSPDQITTKNLEKICREIGLKFRRRGRPGKKPTSKATGVGIRAKPKALSSGHDHSRRTQPKPAKAGTLKRRSR